MILTASYIQALAISWLEVLPRIPAALGITAIFALIAWAIRGVTGRGALAGALITFLVFLAAGSAGFLAILTVFLLTATATQVGYNRKLQLGTAEPRTGRSARQVFANLLASALVITPALAFPQSRSLLLVGMCSALAEAAADTISSELGQALGNRVYLITTFGAVSPGQNGGVSVAGTICGMLAGALVTTASWWMNLVSPLGALVAFVAAVLGMFMDSLLGATLERPERLGNNSVNFLSNTFAAGLGLVGAMMVS